MFGGSIIWKIVAMILLLAAAVGYFKYTQNKIAELNQGIASKEFALKAAANTIEMQQKSIEQQREVIATTSSAFESARSSVRELEEKFSKNGRNFSDIVVENPSAIERKVNDATRKVFRCIENVVNKGVVNEGC